MTVQAAADTCATITLVPSPTISTFTSTFDIASGSVPKFTLPQFSDTSTLTCSVTGYAAYDDTASSAHSILTASDDGSNVLVSVNTANQYVAQTLTFTLQITFDGP